MDTTLTVKQDYLGHSHPVTRTIEELEQIFQHLGFEIVSGRDVETAKINFEALGIKEGASIASEHDTFFINHSNDVLLRSHISPIQVRVLSERKNEDIKIVSSGKVYRRDTTGAIYRPQFFQMEGMWIDGKVSLGNMIWILSNAIRRYFDQPLKIRYRPSWFSYTEPSLLMDISCPVCRGKGCSFCFFGGWTNILGGGMIHPRLFEYLGLRKKRGFAFGLGPSRLSMLKHGVKNAALLFSNDVNFLKQF